MSEEKKVEQGERGAFEAWVMKEWPGLAIDRAELMGFYKGDDGSRIDDLWDAWQGARTGLTEQNYRDSAELRRLCAERDQARRTAECWKAEHSAGNRRIAELEARAASTSANVAQGAEAVRALFQPWPEGELGPTDEPESQYRLGYNTAIEDALDALTAAQSGVKS